MNKLKNNKKFHLRNNSSFSLSKSQSSRSFIHHPMHSFHTDNIGSLYTDADHIDRTSSTPIPEHSMRRPISLTVLEKYFSDICSSINQKNSIDLQLLNKISTMKDVLKDCLNSIDDLSLEIYLLINSSLQDLQHIKSQGSCSITPILMNKLLQIALLIETGNFRSKSEPAAQFTEQIEDLDLNLDLESELESKVGKVTVRVLNLWKKIVTVQKESGIICCCFLLLYCEIDRAIRVSPYFKVKFDKAINIMKDYCSNPGYVVTVVRKTRDYIDRGLISSEIFMRISSSLKKISSQDVKNMDRTMTGFILYELVLFALRYYNYVSKKKNESSSVDLKISPIKSQDSVNNESYLNHSQFESFPTNFSVEGGLSPIKSHSPVQNSAKPAQTALLSEKFKSPVKYINKSSSNLSKQSPNKPAIVSRSTNSPLKSSPTKGLGGKKNEIIKKSPLKTSFLRFQRESLENTSSSSPSGLLKAKFVAKEEKPASVLYGNCIQEFFKNFITKKISIDLGNDLFGNGKSKEQIILQNRESWMKEFEQQVGIIRKNALKKLCEENKFLNEISKAKKQVNNDV